MRKIVRASLLVLALSVSAYADGNMGDPKTQPHPATTTSPVQTSTEPTTDGNMGDPATDGNMGQPEAVTATEVALNLLQNLLALF